MHTDRRTRTVRSAVIATITATALTLAGCGGFLPGGGNGDDNGAGDDGESSRSGPLRVYVNTEQNSGLEPLYEAFEAASGASIDATSTETDELNQQLRIQLTSGTAADLFRVSPGFSSPVAAGVLGAEGELADVSDAQWTQQLGPDIRALSGVDDEVMAFPIARNAVVMAYNTKVFDDLGIEVPTTWSEFIAACDELAAAGVTPIAAPLQGGVYLQFWMYALAATLVYGENPEIDDQLAAGETSFATDDGWNEVFEKFLELRDADFFSDGALGVPVEQGLAAIATGDAGMVLTVTPVLPQIHDYAPGGADDIDIFALPANEDADATRVPVAPDFLAVNASSDRMDLALEFLEFLAEPENVAAYANGLGVLPGLDVDVEVETEALDPILPLLDAGRTAPYANYMWPNGDVQQTMLQSGQEVFDGSIELGELLAQMDAEYAKGPP